MNANGAPISGAKAYFYLTGTTTLENVYADNALTTPLSNPVIADSAGRFPPIFLDPAISYRLIAKDAADVAIANGDVDPLNPTGTTGTSGLQDGAVTTPKLATGAVTTAKIGDGQVTLAKLADIAGPSILGKASGTGPPEAIGLSNPAALNALLGRTGTMFVYVNNTAPTGALKCNGGTIGSAASGAANASADYAALFALIWNLNATDYPILTSGGAGSTRGADAAADFAANKRLPLPNMRGEFLRGLDDGRGVDTGRVLGSSQTEMIGPHTHTFGAAYDFSNGGQAGLTDAGTSASTDANTGTENRPRNVAWPWFIWY
ncbi:MAG: hypothetical protein Q7T61_00870 [Caulobacter sp.]|nr:hypothetical protein [Caulobacter sp.]